MTRSMSVAALVLPVLLAASGDHLNLNKKTTGRQTAACPDISCLAALVRVLKMEKDLVRNFLVQKNRVFSKTSLMASKERKSNQYEETAHFLEKRLGSTEDHKDNSNGPLCKGSYNSTEGLKASEVAHTLEECNGTIQATCSKHTTITQAMKDQLDECETVMKNFKNNSRTCQDGTSDCNCWKNIKTEYIDSKKLADCNIANQMETSIKRDLINCLQTFIACSKKEDAAVEYMVHCYTSKSQIKANIKELLIIKDAASKLLLNQQAIVSTSQRNLGRQLENKREKRMKNNNTVSCAFYITEVNTVETLYTSSSLIGNSAAIVAQTTIIVKKSVSSCSTSEVTKIKANINLLQTVILQITAVITQYQKIMITLTKTTANIAITELVLPPGWSNGVVATTITTTNTSTTSTTTTTNTATNTNTTTITNNTTNTIITKVPITTTTTTTITNKTVTSTTTTTTATTTTMTSTTTTITSITKTTITTTTATTSTTTTSTTTTSTTTTTTTTTTTESS